MPSALDGLPTRTVPPGRAAAAEARAQHTSTPSKPHTHPVHSDQQAAQAARPEVEIAVPAARAPGGKRKLKASTSTFQVGPGSVSGAA